MPSLCRSFSFLISTYPESCVVRHVFTGRPALPWNLKQQKKKKHLQCVPFHFVTAPAFFPFNFSLNNRRWDNMPIIPKKTQQADLIFSHNPIFALFSSRWQYKGNNEKTKKKEIFTRTWVWGIVLRVCVCAVCVCEMFSFSPLISGSFSSSHVSFLRAGSTPPPPPSTTPTTTPQPSPTSAPKENGNSDSKSDSGWDNEANIVGLAVLALLVILTIANIILCCRRWREENGKR